MERLNLKQVDAFELRAFNEDGTGYESTYYKEQAIAEIDAKGGRYGDGAVVPVKAYKDKDGNLFAVTPVGGTFVDNDKNYKEQVRQRIAGRLSPAESLFLGLTTAEAEAPKVKRTRKKKEAVVEQTTK